VQQSLPLSWLIAWTEVPLVKRTPTKPLPRWPQRQPKSGLRKAIEAAKAARQRASSETGYTLSQKYLVEKERQAVVAELHQFDDLLPIHATEQDWAYTLASGQAALADELRKDTPADPKVLYRLRRRLAYLIAACQLWTKSFCGRPHEQEEPHEDRAAGADSMETQLGATRHRDGDPLRFHPPGHHGETVEETFFGGSAPNEPDYMI
jgi:hypothetical protein